MGILWRLIVSAKVVSLSASFFVSLYVRIVLCIFTLLCTILPVEMAEQEIFSTHISSLAAFEDLVEDDGVPVVSAPSRRHLNPQAQNFRREPQQKMQVHPSSPLPRQLLVHFDGYIHVICRLRL